MESKIRAALRQGEYDYAEVRIHRGRVTAIAWIGEELEDIGEHSGVGGCVRVLRDGGWGFVSFNDIENLPAYVRAACDAARLVGGGAESLAPAEPSRATVPAEPEEAASVVPLAEKKEICERYNRIILDGSDRIRTSSVRYADRSGVVVFANSEGAYLEEETAFCGIGLSATAMDGTNVQHGYHPVGDLRGFQIVRGLESECEHVVQRAVDLLSAEKVRGGRYTVIMDPKLTGVFVHEAFGHLSEADFIYENERLCEIMTLGRRFGGDLVTIVDDPTLPRLAGSYAYDHEGTKAAPSVLLAAGVLKGRLHSRETAARMDERPTGNARALNHTFAPLVRMSNTYMVAGPHSFEEMLAATGDGVYAVGFQGGQTNMEMFTFAAEEAWEIKNGAIGRRLRDLTLTGNVFETLMNVDMVAGDVVHYGGLGGCGKDGQGPLRVSSGGPHTRTRNLLIGGDA